MQTEIKFDESKVEALKKYLIKNPEYFKDGKTDTHAIDEVIWFKIRNPERVIYYGEHFLCDIYGNEIWVVALSKKKLYNRMRKQWLSIIPICKIVDNCDKHFRRFNGYWMIPNKFLLKDKK